MKKVEGLFNGQSLKIAIVVSRFNEFITSKLLGGAIDCLERHEVNNQNINTIWVPGSFEIPLVAKKLAMSKNYDAIICLGALIRGDTPHFDYVSAETSKGIARVTYETEVPVIFGVLTTENIEQAIERAGTKAGNKGWECAMSAIEMSNLLRRLE